MTSLDYLKRHGACRDIPKEVFFPENSRQAAMAKKICASCPASNACLEYAIANLAAHDQGIWAGMTIQQIKAMAQARGQWQPNRRPRSYDTMTDAERKTRKRTAQQRRRLANGRGGG